MALAKTDTESWAKVHVDPDGIILLEIHGAPSVTIIRKMHDDVLQVAERVEAQGKKVLILCTVAHMRASDSSSAERAEAKRLFADVPSDAWAIVGNSQILTLALYLARVARPSLKVKAFKNAHLARAWLKGRTAPKVVHSPIALVTGIGVIAIGLLGLLGWQLSNRYLLGISPNFRPINPMAAVGLLIAGWGFIAHWRNRIDYVRFTGVLGMVLGIIALLPLRIDYWLYGDRVTAIGAHTHFATSAAICFIALGLVGVTIRRSNGIDRLVQALAAIVIGGLALFNIFGQLYAYDFIYNIGGDFVMALSLAFAFVIATTGLVLLSLYRQMGNVLASISNIGWLTAAAFVFIQFATYATWHQSDARNRNESRSMFLSQADNLNTSVANRVSAYMTVLRGFRGFYASSTFVNQGEFQGYYNSLDLQKNYPGLRSMAYIAAVPTKDLATFAKQQQQDRSLNPGGNPDFKISSQTNSPVHFIATYVSDQSAATAALGLDLTSIPGREQIYNSALRSGESYASGTVMFRASSKEPAQEGFFITIPVHNEGAADNVGVVNVNFNYKDFFPTLFTAHNLNENLNIIMTDANGKTVFSSKHSKGDLAASKTFTIPVATSALHMRVEAAKNFGISSGQVKLTPAILLIGQIIAGLLALIFVSQLLARRQALALVDEITSDLQNERNKVVELHQKDEAILSGLGEGLIVINKHGRVDRINAAASRMLGVSEQEITGKEFTKAWHAVDMNFHEVPEEKRPITLALQKGKTVDTRLYYVRKNGEQFPVEMSVAPVILNGKVIAAIEVFRDITHELELDKAKSEFVSLASHQLRTPLSAINWYAEMLLNGDAGKITEDQREYLREIFEGNQRMIELVNSLLDVSRLELGRMANEPAPTSLVGLVEDIEKELKTSIIAKKLDFEKELQARLPEIMADPKQLRMVVQNLLSNAVKYTVDKGKVTVVLRNATAQDIQIAKLHPGGKYLYFHVEDTGYGIPKTQQPHIFEKLFRADNVRKLDVEGTGLGLYIVKQVVESMGGRVWFDSMESVGTTFHVVLPVVSHAAKRDKPNNA